MNFIDSFLNRITMYRLVLYYLIALLASAGILGLLHVLPYSPLSIGYSVAVLLASSWATNAVFARIWRAVPGSASLYITALILALLMTPVVPGDVGGTALLAMLGVWAMASKYLLALYGKHVFNPAAFAVALSTLLLGHAASWWVGTLPLVPILLIGGLLVVRKMQYFDLFVAFSIAALVTVALTAQGSAVHAVETTLLHSSFFFLAFVMLTEPATMPPTRDLRLAYGALVGIWFAPAFHVGSLYFTPELALLAGNVFTYLVSPKGRFALTFTHREEIARDTHEFVFTSNRRLRFAPGQYMEWTVSADRRTDAKGNRRYFTVASSPLEPEIRLAVKLANPASTFKKKLLALVPGDTITTAQLAGDFTLPKDASRKLAFIAGGIGVTPFRSMTATMLTEGARDTVMLYSNKTAEEIAYYDFFEHAQEKLGMKVVYALTNDARPFNGAHLGAIDAALIAREIPDYTERTFYISGPRSMVVAFESTLRELGVANRYVKTDFFPGFA